jgi:hypothetical protein
MGDRETLIPASLYAHVEDDPCVLCNIDGPDAWVIVRKRLGPRRPEITAQEDIQADTCGYCSQHGFQISQTAQT